MDEEREFRRQHTHRWWVVAATLVAVLGVLAAIWWQPVTAMVRPSWTAAAWHLVAVDDGRMTVAVEDEVCDPDEEAGPVRLHVVERDAEVIVEAERQTDWGLPFVPRSCAPTTKLVFAHAQLDEPLDDRTLHGCRLVDSRKATDPTFDADDDCRPVAPSLR